MTDHRSEDADLVAGVAAGDEEALESIYRKYGGAVQRLARRILHDELLAQDVAQETFVSFWRAPNRSDSERESLRTYLLTIAHRRAVDAARSEAARTRREATTPLEPSTDVVSNLSREHHAPARLVPDQPASEEIWGRIAAATDTGQPAPNNVLPLRRHDHLWLVATGIAASAALVFGALFLFDSLAGESLDADGIVAAASLAADQSGSLVGDFLVETEPMARLALTENGLGLVIPSDPLPTLDESRTHQLWLINENREGISAGVLGHRPVPAVFTWTGDASGFALTREVSGAVVSSAGAVISVIDDI